jgi:hypothetical protein
MQSLNQTLMRQVVAMTVEVLQVNLNEFQSGIDWNYVSETHAFRTVGLKGPTAVTSPETAGRHRLGAEKQCRRRRPAAVSGVRKKFGRVRLL